jgi:gamma-glutamylcyclotransferase (GGCT)/AIG2-like uncharacterized protein YtfP
MNSGKIEYLNAHKGLPRIFVYGTLKEGLANDRRLKVPDEAFFLGREHLHGNYCMLDIGGIPGVVAIRKPVDKKYYCKDIIGEVYAVSTRVLMSIDKLERHPNWYERRMVPTKWKNAWCYFLPEAYLDETKYASIIHQGIFMPTPAEKIYAKTTPTVQD